MVKQDDRPASISDGLQVERDRRHARAQSGDLGDLPQRPGWQEIMPDPRVPAWTDDYSDILGAILRKKLAR